jgi:DNA invertase Pin-like site-specific DNA recombinase
MTGKIILYRRFSTDEQEGGDSLTRQLEACEAFAQSKGWTITDRLEDEGFSAFKNAHIEFGKLGTLTRQIQNGELERGTILIAEKLDRLSRREFGEAMAWIWNLTKQGVVIAIADSGAIYDHKPDIGSFISAAVTADQNHRESEKKSVNVLSAKRNLWRDAQTKTGKWVNAAARIPSWLTRNETRNGWIVDDGRAAIVRQIYEWSADGLGSAAICRRLNEAGEPSWGVWRKAQAAQWGITAVNILLGNPAVEGELRAESGQFAGQSIPDFYPRIVDADLVARARAGKAERTKITKNGRGEYEHSRGTYGTAGLFSGRTVCGECGGAATISSHTKEKKGRSYHYRYLRCEAYREGRDCSNGGYYPYHAFEESALGLCIDLALDDRFFESSGDLKRLRVAKAEAEKAIADKRQARARLMTFLEDGDDQMLGRVRELKVEIDRLATDLAVIETDLQKAAGKVGDIEHLSRVNDIREAAKSDDANTREQARAKLQRALAAIIGSVAIERDDIGRKVFTVALAGGVLAARFDDKGEVIGLITDAAGKPLYENLDDEDRETLAPLIKRIRARIGGKASKPVDLDQFAIVSRSHEGGLLTDAARPLAE